MNSYADVISGLLTGMYYVFIGSLFTIWTSLRIWIPISSSTSNWLAAPTRKLSSVENRGYERLSKNLYESTWIYD